MALQATVETRRLPSSQALNRIGRAVRSNRKATAGTLLLVIFILVALFPSVIAHDSPPLDAFKPHLGLLIFQLRADLRRLRGAIAQRNVQRQA